MDSVTFMGRTTGVQFLGIVGREKLVVRKHVPDDETLHGISAAFGLVFVYTNFPLITGRFLKNLLSPFATRCIS
jgi:hypothetical protein